MNSEYMTLSLLTYLLDLEGHPKSKVILQMNLEYMTSYQSAIITMGLRIAVYEMQTNDIQFTYLVYLLT